jgi:hypothetical protein
VHPETFEKLQQWTLTSLEGSLDPSRNGSRLCHRHARAEVEAFHEAVIRPYVLKPDQWTLEKSAFILVLAYMSDKLIEDVHRWFGKELASGVQGSLSRYRFAVRFPSTSEEGEASVGFTTFISIPTLFYFLRYLSALPSDD